MARLNPIERRARKPPRKAKPGALRRILRWVLIAVAAGYACLLLFLFAMRWIDPPVTGVQLQRYVEASLTGRKYARRYQPVPLSRISQDLQHAVVAAEDARFYQHYGIDWTEIRKVLDQGREKGTLSRGASTITQQLVKNLFFTTHRSPIRKAVEYTLVPFAELMLSKQRILELYLNVAEWGPGVFGAEAAAQYHYDAPAAQVGREDAARLAACLPDPQRRRPQRMHDYSGEILTRMSQMGW